MGGGGLFFQAHLRGGLLSFVKMVVSILHERTSVRSKKAQAREVGGHVAEDQNKSELPAHEQTMPDHST